MFLFFSSFVDLNRFCLVLKELEPLGDKEQSLVCALLTVKGILAVL